MTCTARIQLYLVCVSTMPARASILSWCTAVSNCIETSMRVNVEFELLCEVGGVGCCGRRERNEAVHGRAESR